jgi:hypothetical protein
MYAYILLDRTGSMQALWDEALSSVNHYAADLRSTPDARITLAVFDHALGGLQFDVLRRSVPAEAWQDVIAKEATPRGMTPLFDAIGQMIALAEQDAPEKAVLVIMTDGEENSSRELNRRTAKQALDRVQARDWQVVFLGADFARFNDAGAMGIGSSQTMAIAPGAMKSTMSTLARKSSRYFSSGEHLAFSANDRAEAKESSVQRKA